MGAKGNLNENKVREGRSLKGKIKGLKPIRKKKKKTHRRKRRLEERRETG